MKSKRSAFTLVELLVVIAIIGVLIAILLPTLSRVRRQANTTRCMGNMRQLLQAVILYTHDNSEFLPYTGWGHAAGMRNWAYLDSGSASGGNTGQQSDLQGGQLWKYLGVYSVYRCPSDAGPWPAGSFNNLSSYSLNGAVSAYSSNLNAGLNYQRFKPDDVFFWELTIQGNNGANDATNYPSEGITARHKLGTCLGHADGHVDILPATEFNALCQQLPTTPFPNMLFCDPTKTDGGRGAGSPQSPTIPIEYEN